MNDLKQRRVHADQSTNPAVSFLKPEDKDKVTQKESFNQLRQLFLIENRIKFPNVPEAYRAVPSYKDSNTNGLTRCVMDYVRLRGYFIERTGNTGRQINDQKTYTDSLGFSKTIGSTKWIKGSGTNGTSDLKSIVNGRFIAIEVKCKSTNDRIRPDQLKYKLQIEKSGGVYIIASTFSQFKQWFDNFIQEGKL
jgi:hypothetical protein